MAKGRKQTTSRSERLLGSYTYSNGQDTPGGDSSELGEEDVWSMVADGGERNDYQIVNNSEGDWSPRTDIESNSGSISIRSRRRIPRDVRHVGGLSLAFEDSSSGKAAASRIVHQFRGHDSMESPAAAAAPRHMATSAPVNVPDWSKILRVESLHDSDDGFDDRDSEMVPPHEYLAREYARSKKMGGASVFEGVGRTLKGRDLWRVRDAVWSQTGFYG